METETERTARYGRRTAVIGSGVAGLTAAYLLGRAGHVTLYEADDRLGGHAHTHELTSPQDGRVHRVDSGFIVHNRRTYPRLLRLFDELGVPTQESEMSMSVRCEGCGLEYAGARGPAGLFAQPRNLLRPRYLRLLAEVPLFHRAARRLLPGAAKRPSPWASSWTGRATPPISAPTSSRRWCRPYGPATPRPPNATRPPICSGSWSTTACCPSAARPCGARSPAARAPTSSASPSTSAISGPTPPCGPYAVTPTAPTSPPRTAPPSPTTPS